LLIANCQIALVGTGQQAFLFSNFD